MNLIGRLKSEGGASWHISVCERGSKSSSLITQICVWPSSSLARVTAVITACVDLTVSCEMVQVMSRVLVSWPECVCRRGVSGTRPGHVPVREERKRRIRYYCDLLHKLFETSCTVSLFKTSAVHNCFYAFFLNVWHCILYNATHNSRLECFLPWVYWYVLYLCCILWILQELMHNSVN